jgi:hypothetical protein
VSHGFDFKRSETFRQNHHSSPAKMKYKKEPVKKKTQNTQNIKQENMKKRRRKILTVRWPVNFGYIPVHSLMDNFQL